MDGAVAAMTDNDISDAINVRWNDLQPGQVWWHRGNESRYTYQGATEALAPRGNHRSGAFYSTYADTIERVWTNKSATDIMTFPPYPPIDEGF